MNYANRSLGIGDRVKALEDYGSVKKGQVGVIKGIADNDGQTYPHIEWDEQYNTYSFTAVEYVDSLFGNSLDDSYNNFCDHSWTNYQGLLESFKFCSKCDIKKGR